MPALTRFSLPAAVMAAAFFLLALLAALLLVPQFLPAQHPLALLGTLPGLHGPLFRWLLFILPGLLLGASVLCQPAALLGNRAARIGQHLGVMAAVGFMLMGALEVGLDASLEVAMRGQALAWLLWLAAVLAAMTLTAIGQYGQDRRTASVLSLLAGLATVLLSLVPLPALAAPLAQLLAWLLWMAWVAGLARLGAQLLANTAEQSE